MDIVVDAGDVVLPASAVAALERAVRDAVSREVDAIAKLELRLSHLRSTSRSWLCSARATFADGRVVATELRSTSPTAAALVAARAIALPPLRNAG